MSGREPHPKRGMAMMLVLAISLIVLTLGMAMISLSGQSLSGSVDSKTRIKARYAAEAGISAAIADAVYQAGEIFGGGITASHREVHSESGKGEADVSSGSNLGQEVILQKRSPMNQLRGNKIPLKIEAVGRSGSAKSKVSATVALYQVPIYQFGVFYDGPLEITPGPDMVVMGRVHTNRSAYFRGVATLTLNGPVTVADTIFQWVRPGGTLKYRSKADSAGLFTPNLTNNLTPMNSAGTSQPPEINGLRNVRFGETRLILPIGVGTPRSILGLRDPSDVPALRRQKFDWIVKTRSSDTARFVYTSASTYQPTWIKGPFVFFDRREMTWVKIWDFDVAALATAGNRDSIFYLDDTTTSTWHISGSTKKTLNAFRIVNARVLPRNMTIASGKPVYILGDFNRQNASGDTTKYVNAQIASDAVTVLSAQWMDWKASSITGATTGSMPATISSREQAFSNTDWLGCTYCGTAPAVGYTGVTVTSDVRINTAMITGNKQTRAAVLANNTTETYFDANYEGGWHNTLRFLEDWGQNAATRKVVFKGSFVCLWEAATPGLRTSPTDRVGGGPYYRPPQRIWGYDTRFDNLANMPPGAPFLATAIVTNWLERN